MSRARPFQIPKLSASWNENWDANCRGLENQRRLPRQAPALPRESQEPPLPLGPELLVEVLPRGGKFIFEIGSKKTMLNEGNGSGGYVVWRKFDFFLDGCL
jgi:hypothetical protein